MIDWAHPFTNPVPELWTGYPRAVYDCFNASQRAGYNPNYRQPGDPAGHKGLDLGANEGSPITAAHPGKVHHIISPANNPLAGNGVELVEQVTGGWWGTRYLHMPSAPIVTVGQTVRVGQRVGSVGKTGNANYPHCHFEIRWIGDLTSRSLVTQGVPLDPLRFDLFGQSEPLPSAIQWPRLLRPKESHGCVPHLRGLLYGLGYWPARSMAAHRYTTKVAQAVRDFQDDHGLDVDGIVGPSTREALADETGFLLT